MNTNCGACAGEKQCSAKGLAVKCSSVADAAKGAARAFDELGAAMKARDAELREIGVDSPDLDGLRALPGVNS